MSAQPDRQPLSDRQSLPDRQPHSTAHDDHGHSVAAWTTVGLIMVGSVIAAIGFPLDSPPVFWAGVVVMLLAVALGYVWSRSNGDAMPAYTETTPLETNAEGPTRSSEGTNRI